MNTTEKTTVRDLQINVNFAQANIDKVKLCLLKGNVEEAQKRLRITKKMLQVFIEECNELEEAII